MTTTVRRVESVPLGFGSVHEKTEIRVATTKEWVTVCAIWGRRRRAALGDNTLESVEIQLAEKRFVVILICKIELHDELSKLLWLVDDEITIRVGYP